MGVMIARLLQDNSSLFGISSSQIARLTEIQLNSFTQQGWSVRSIAAIPDFHNFGMDGGVKDISFVLVRAESPARGSWKVRQVIPDHATMHGRQSNWILEQVTAFTQAIEKSGGKVWHLIYLTDHHRLATLNGVGGYDGVKNVLVCYT